MYLISRVGFWNAVSMHKYVSILSWVETGSEAIQTFLLCVRAAIPDNKGQYVTVITHLRLVSKIGK
jgi:hypothetical protein